MSFLDFSGVDSPFKIKNVNPKHFDLEPTESLRAYLTFDDGPFQGETEFLLDVLEELNMKVTFFVIGVKARDQRALIARMRMRGHSVGDHSWDHSYVNFFKSTGALKSWILKSWHSLSDILGESPCGFRSPAGVVTPPLVKCLEELRIPLYLWKHRYFDTRMSLQRVSRNQILSIQNGDLVLLHEAGDQEKQKELVSFLRRMVSEWPPNARPVLSALPPLKKLVL